MYTENLKRQLDERTVTASAAVRTRARVLSRRREDAAARRPGVTSA